MKPNLYEKLISSGLLKQIKHFCDVNFEVVKSLETLEIVSNEKMISIATDASGGAYILQFENDINNSPIIYLGFEGDMELVAKTFEDFINVIVFTPFWQDILKFSQGGNLQEMKRVTKKLEEEWAEYYPDKKEFETKLITVLKIKPKSNIEELLHEAINQRHIIKIQSKNEENFGRIVKNFTKPYKPDINL